MLDGEDVFTVFAPTNEAFEKFPEDLDSINAETLTDILLFHAVAGKEIYREDLVCQDLLEMANGVDSRTICDGPERYQKGAGNPEGRVPYLIESDIQACNGIIHMVDDVMLPRIFKKCDKKGFSRFPNLGLDNSQRLLFREGVISEIPPKLCPQDREMNNITKNVILVIGDGMVRCQQTKESLALPNFIQLTCTCCLSGMGDGSCWSHCQASNPGIG